MAAADVVKHTFRSSRTGCGHASHRRTIVPATAQARNGPPATGRFVPGPETNHPEM